MVKLSLVTSTLIITVPLLKVSTYGTFLIHVLYLLYYKCLTYLLGGTARWLAGTTIIAAPSPAIIAEPVFIVNTILPYTSTVHFIMLVLYILIKVF